ncbi:MAG TPA: TVP38/TMEM64 family protein [Thermoanaerobaculia bacterium]|jgi:uncharacterized membrane protein YdjX (TVP38/TMEM64 family)|nr:TVP38/TMEM64 family protein [Thermoanaerobaculia bacterium]
MAKRTTTAASRSPKWKRNWRWIASAAAIAALIGAWNFLPLKDWLKAVETSIDGLGIVGPILYGLAYLVAELLMVPGAILMVGAGYLFGLAAGMAIVWLAATLAAALSFVIARRLARDRIERFARRHKKFAALDGAIAQGNWKIVALLRFSPVVPFGLSNYMYGLSRMRFAPYIAATALGMLPGTFLYVYLGTAGRGFGGGWSPWHWALIGVGLVATAAASIYLTRLTKKRLRRRAA